MGTALVVELRKKSSDFTGDEKLHFIKTHWNALQGIPSDVINITSLLSGKAPSGHNHDDRYYTESEITSLLAGKQDKITGSATTITSSNLTANRALITNSDGKVAISAVTSTELHYLSGVTSGIQTQLHGKANNNEVVKLTTSGDTIQEINSRIDISNTSIPFYSTRKTTANGGIYAAAMFTRDITTGTPADGNGPGIYFRASSSTRAITYAGIFGGRLAVATQGATVGEIVLGPAWNGADPYQRADFRVRARSASIADAYINGKFYSENTKEVATQEWVNSQMPEIPDLMVQTDINNSTSTKRTISANLLKNNFYLKSETVALLNAKEPAFSKNTAFNKNFGTTAGTVAEGNHSHTWSEITGKPSWIGTDRPSDWKEIYAGPSVALSETATIGLTVPSNIYAGKTIAVEIRYGSNSSTSYTNRIVLVTLGTSSTTNGSKTYPRYIGFSEWDGVYLKNISTKCYVSTTSSTTTIIFGYLKTLIGQFTGTTINWTTQDTDSLNVYIGKIWLVG